MITGGDEFREAEPMGGGRIEIGAGGPEFGEHLLFAGEIGAESDELLGLALVCGGSVFGGKWIEC